MPSSLKTIGISCFALINKSSRFFSFEILRVNFCGGFNLNMYGIMHGRWFVISDMFQNVLSCEESTVAVRPYGMLPSYPCDMLPPLINSFDVLTPYIVIPILSTLR